MTRLSVFLALSACAARGPVPGDLSAEMRQLAEATAQVTPPSGELSPERVLVPVGRWVQIGETVGFTYVDSEAGLSFQASTLGTVAGSSTMVILRLMWRPDGLRVLSAEERAAMGLPDVPEWLAYYGPQPPAGTLHGHWRFDERFEGRFHSAEYPDDLQVMFADAGAEASAEYMWVSIRACTADRCVGRLLNQPFGLRSVKAGDTVSFAIAGTGAMLVGKKE